MMLFVKAGERLYSPVLQHITVSCCAALKQLNQLLLSIRKPEGETTQTSIQFLKFRDIQ